MAVSDMDNNNVALYNCLTNYNILMITCACIFINMDLKINCGVSKRG